MIYMYKSASQLVPTIYKTFHYSSHSLHHIDMNTLRVIIYKGV